MRPRLVAVLALLVGLMLFAPVAAEATSPSALPDGAIPLEGGGYALEAKAETPAWYTAELHRRVVVAGRRGESVPLPENANVDSALLFTGIRPGSWMIFPAGCTTNWVFGNPDTGPAYIGTAGHCTSVGDEVTIIAAPGVLMNIGRTISSVDNDLGDDQAFIEIHPEMLQFVNPSMAIVAGPTGAVSPDWGDPVVHVGHGLVIGTGGTARGGVVTWVYDEHPLPLIGGATDPNAYGWTGAVSPGDSGSPVRAASGEAVGNATHIVVGTAVAPATAAGTDIDRILQLAPAPLATASLIPSPLP